MLVGPFGASAAGDRFRTALGQRSKNIAVPRVESLSDFVTNPDRHCRNAAGTDTDRERAGPMNRHRRVVPCPGITGNDNKPMQRMRIVSDPLICGRARRRNDNLGISDVGNAGVLAKLE